MQINATDELTKIVDRMKTNFEYIVGASPTGVIEGLIVALASEELSYVAALERYKEDRFLTTASMDALIRHKGQVVEPRFAEKSRGEIWVTGEKETKVPKNTRFSDVDGNTYIATEDAIIKEESISFTIIQNPDNENLLKVVTGSTQIPNTTCLINGIQKECKVISSSAPWVISFTADGVKTGDTINQYPLIFTYAKVKVEAMEAGRFTNKEFNNYVTMDKELDKVNADCRVIDLYGGEDDEEIEKYRKRCLEHERVPLAPFSKSSIIYMLRDKIPNLLYITTRAGVPKAGQVTIYAIDKDYSLAQELSTDILNEVRAIKPANILDEDIKCVKIKVKDVRIKIKNLVPSGKDIRDTVTDRLVTHFKLNLYYNNQEVKARELERIIYDTTFRGNRVTDFTLESGATTSGNNECLRLLKTNVEYEE